MGQWGSKKHEYKNKKMEELGNKNEVRNDEMKNERVITDEWNKNSIDKNVWSNLKLICDH